jgi:acyl carrier protein
VHIRTADVAVEGEFARALREVTANGRPLAAVFHCAGVSDPQLIDQIDEAAFDRVWQAKVVGTRHVLDATASHALDAVVMFSSIAVVLPAAGQASYAAANAFMDAAAANASADGRPALTLNWGAWADVGMAAELDRRGALERPFGMESFSVEQAVALLLRVAGERPRSQLVLMSVDPTRRAEFAGTPLLSALVPPVGMQPPASAGGDDELHAALAAAETADQRRIAIEQFLQAQIARVLKRPAARIALTAPLRGLGLDSLMALELRNRLEAETGLRLPATLAWNYPTVTAMAPFIAARLDVSLTDEPVADAAAADPTLAQLLAEIEQLSDDEARRLSVDADGGVEHV